MALRLYITTLSDNVAAVTPEMLTATVGSAAVCRPMAIQDVTPGYVTGTCSQIIIEQNLPGGEVMHRLFDSGDPSTEVPAAPLVAALMRVAVRSGPITPLTFAAEKGMQLRFESAGTVAGILQWDVCSDCQSGVTTAENEVTAEG